MKGGHRLAVPGLRGHSICGGHNSGGTDLVLSKCKDSQILEYRVVLGEVGRSYSFGGHLLFAHHCPLAPPGTHYCLLSLIDLESRMG